MAIDYSTVNSRAIQLLLSVKKHTSAIDAQLKSLIELRVSQINGCAYCVDMHSIEARNAGESQQRLDCLPVWRECQLFTTREMAALEWAESVTQLPTDSSMQRKLNTVLEHFTETETVDLTLIIALMNCMNRVSISFGDKPSPRTQ